ncbi:MULTISPECIES: NmrA family NAD(P)-binding protein [Tatumella]|uniref:SDR family oxidoreductase n=1 Tax=Tatumella punctata TaxID=399969 RepID=A0ABW1VNM1_9GAMM|nr:MULTISPECIES: NmrA family NAD(P)-binding protein [unclassified Tatumella]MBS0854798.1 NmrA family NAD(P)-binding protein [Tatumella sp. JGM16]MBS0878424.1 NmrA family NAD(P)-binding protein [Tatumella sp. JGM82]MBS0892000.1 NmrA family NAD(P)-binding protein [Tatumella sp. JGM94]MBS0892952.1 NmrA family NAD(P)-binding protein [Tatumella sp. JGM130]MBS0903118.1 NmrA family NAD(P)-binding protein [Tatumella sp. JGM100]
MTVLVTGSTGTIGKVIVNKLAEQGINVRALMRTKKEGLFPETVTTVTGDMTSVSDMKKALQGVDTLFLLNAVVPDELTQALITLDLAVEAGVKNIVYFSVFNREHFINVPHFTSKYTVEKAIKESGLHATILQPAYFYQNDSMLQEAIKHYNAYPMPVGNQGVAMVDARDIAEVAALEIIQREHSEQPLPLKTIEITGPDLITGEKAAAVWSSVLGTSVSYAGDDLDALENMMLQFANETLARDMKIMFRSFQTGGMKPAADTVSNVESILNRKLKTYQEFIAESVR